MQKLEESLEFRSQRMGHGSVGLDQRFYKYSQNLQKFFTNFTPALFPNTHETAVCESPIRNQVHRERQRNQHLLRVDYELDSSCVLHSQ